MSYEEQHQVLIDTLARLREAADLTERLYQKNYYGPAVVRKSRYRELNTRVHRALYDTQAVLAQLERRIVS